jgi:hypothetical protein
MLVDLKSDRVQIRSGQFEFKKKFSLVSQIRSDRILSPSYKFKWLILLLMVVYPLN